MKLVEFINKCDLEGGLAEGFEYGLIPQSIDLFENKDVRQAIYDAYKGWELYKQAEDKYYSLIEDGDF